MALFKRSFLQYSAKKQKGTLLGETARAVLGKHAKVSDTLIDRYFKRLNHRQDCADFFGMHIIHALFTHKSHPFLSQSQIDKLHKALLNFKYWVDEPGQNKMIMYTENHQILFHCLEYLSGQLLKDDIFKNNRKSGKWHQEHARKLAITWMERRARWGYNEWSSNVYFAKDLQSLLFLAEFAKDSEMSKLATISLDILLLEITVNQYYGFHASTHGRAYERDILNGYDNDIASSIKLIWGLGTFGKGELMAALALTCAKKYRPLDVIIKIGQNMDQDLISLERNGLSIQDLENYGISTNQLEDSSFLWGMGAFSLPEVIDLFIHACDEWNLWELPFFDFLGDKHSFLPRDGSLGKLMKKKRIDFNRALLGEVNIITYRTKDYMLSTAQDYRPGGIGYQHHIWQATLSPNAMYLRRIRGLQVILMNL